MRRALLPVVLFLPDAVCPAVVGAGTCIIGFPTAVSVILHVGAVSIIGVAVAAVGEVIDTAVV